MYVPQIVVVVLVGISETDDLSFGARSKKVCGKVMACYLLSLLVSFTLKHSAPFECLKSNYKSYIIGNYLVVKNYKFEASKIKSFRSQNFKT